MSQFLSGGEHEDSRLLDYEATLKALLSLIGRQVLVLFSGTDAAPFIAGIIAAASTAANPTSACRNCCSAATHQRWRRFSSTSARDKAALCFVQTSSSAPSGRATNN